MKQFFKNLKEKYPILKIIGNRYVLGILFFLIWMVFLDNYSYFEHRAINKEIDELEINKKFYQEEIKKDCLNIKKMRNPDFIEKYAREKYYMKKDSEDIFIIEYEGEKKENDSQKFFIK